MKHDASTLRGAGRGDLAGVRGGGGPERAAGPLQRGRQGSPSPSDVVQPLVIPRSATTQPSVITGNLLASPIT